jgi:hypothetical protein
MRGQRPAMHWLGRLVVLAVGWRLAMTYPLNDELPSVLLSLAVGTLGVAFVAVGSYAAGFIDGKDRR